MAINPFTLNEAGKAIGKGMEEASKSVHKYIEEKNKTERHKTAEKEETHRQDIDAKKENRASEIESSKHQSDNMTDIAKTAVDKFNDANKHQTDSVKEMVKDSNEQMVKTTERTLEHTKNVINSVAHNSSKMTDDLNNQIAKKNQTIETYQKSLHSVQVKVAQFQIQEQMRNEILYKIVDFAARKLKYDEVKANAKENISLKQREIDPLQEALRETEIERRIIDTQFTDLCIEFDKQAGIIESLQDVLSDEIDESRARKLINKEIKKLKRLTDKIEEKELELLNKEHTRLCQQEELEPLLDVLEEFEISLKYLENEINNQLNLEMHTIAIPSIENRVDGFDSENLVFQDENKKITKK